MEQQKWIDVARWSLTHQGRPLACIYDRAQAFAGPLDDNKRAKVRQKLQELCRSAAARRTRVGWYRLLPQPGPCQYNAAHGLAIAGRVGCQKCLDIRKRESRVRQQQRNDAGLCERPKCQNKPEIGMTRCGGCRSHVRQVMRDWLDLHRDESEKKGQLRAAGYVAQGKCPTCPEHREIRRGTRCDECKTRRNVQGVKSDALAQLRILVEEIRARAMPIVEECDHVHPPLPAEPVAEARYWLTSRDVHDFGIKRGKWARLVQLATIAGAATSPSP